MCTPVLRRIASHCLLVRRQTRVLSSACHWPRPGLRATGHWVLCARPTLPDPAGRTARLSLHSHAPRRKSENKLRNSDNLKMQNRNEWECFCGAALADAAPACPPERSSQFKEQGICPRPPAPPRPVPVRSRRWVPFPSARANAKRLGGAGGRAIPRPADGVCTDEMERQTVCC